MSTQPAPRKPAWRRAAPAVLLAGLLGASASVPALAFVAGIRGASRLTGPLPGGYASPPVLPFGPLVTDTRTDVPGIRQPPAVAAAEAGLDDGEPVVGVVGGDHCRAYSIRALARGEEYHIVNDVLGGVPVSVTHCSLFQCTRVFTCGEAVGPDEAGEPLDLAQGGLAPGGMMMTPNGWVPNEGGMVLKSGSRRYRQDSGAALDSGGTPFPYRPYPSELTTWGQWRRAHPDTDVYVGES